MMRGKIEISTDKIAEFCRKQRIRRLAIFGSTLNEDFKPDGD